MLVTENYKHLKFSTNKLQRFEDYNMNVEKTSSNLNRQPKGFWQFQKGIIDDFVGNCSIPGLYRILTTKLNNIKRFLWLSGFTAAMSIFIYISWSVLYIDKTKPFVTVVATTHYPVYRIPFPEITICNRNRLNWQRYELAKEKYLKAQHQSKEYEEIFMETINAYDTLAFGKFNNFENLTKIPTHYLQSLSYVNFSSVVELMAWKCEEILSDCVWLHQNYNCCDIFFMRNSQMGSCLAFNTVESADGRMKKKSDPYWPWHSHGSGSNNGLKVNVHIKEYLHSPKSRNEKGIKFMLVEPNVWYYTPINVNRHTKTTVAFSTVLHFFDDYTRYYSSKLRQCIFEDELSSRYYKSLRGIPYMWENCQSECQQEYLMKFCNCTMDLFYPPGSYRSCKLSDLPCLYKHNDKLQYVQKNDESEYVSLNFSDFVQCLCYSNCKALNYIIKVHAADMANTILDGNNSHIELAFFFTWDTMMVYRTTVTYTRTNLMAAIGGLASLCIGCSLISLIEFFYFFLADLSKKSLLYFKTRNKLNVLRKSHDIKKNIVRDNLSK